MTVWKIGSRWSKNGTRESSVLDIFRKHQIVFAGVETQKILDKVKIDDYIAISDGLKIVAISKVRELPKKITEFSIDEKDKNRFDYEDWVVGIKVHIVDLEQKDYKQCKMGTFHRQNKDANELITIYNNENKNFSIEAKTYTIRGKNENFLNNDVRYKIPIYQRPYSWGKVNIQKFLQDITTAYCDENGSIVKEPIFFGNMQFSIKKYYDKDGYKFEQDVIDGQQRLSTILVFIKVMQIQPEFKDNEKIQTIKTTWLETQVNNQTQNEYLQKFLEIKDIEELTEDTNNKYIQNAFYINGFFNDFVNESFPEDGQNKFDIEDFIYNHFFENLYFVVIETRAGLSKMLQIFDTINTTGLSLKGTDVFKIRMFEYLKDKKNEKDEVFEKINSLYEQLDKENTNLRITSMEEILGIYQMYLIGKYKLSRELYSLNVNTFFERLFDVILNINKHLHFNNLPSDFELSLEKIEKIIEARISVDKAIKKLSPMQSCEYRFILSSRYGRYWRLIVLFYLENSSNGLEQFISKLSKVLCIHSIKYQKSINWIHTVLRELNELIVAGNSPIEIENWFKEKGFFSEKERNEFKGHLEKSIANNGKWKFIICRTSAMLEDKDNPELLRQLFDTKINIEHIQSYLDKDKNQRAEILNDEEWKKEINSIGNLVILEEHINKSIGNNEYNKKIQGYNKSDFKIISKQVANYNKIWGLEDVKNRKEYEVGKLLNYYFSQQ